MRKIRALIADDEPLARERIAMLAGRDGEVEVVGTCSDGESTLQAIRTMRPDLVFLDVQMPRLSGVEILQSLPPEERPTVIFVTAHHQYAIKAFEMCALDYLLKPFADDRFQLALFRAKEGIRRAALGEIDRRAEMLFDCLRRLERIPEAPGGRAAVEPPGRIAFKIGGEYLFVGADEIAWIEAAGDLIKFRADGKTHQVRETLQSVEQRLDPRRFVRVHRSFLVNIGSIRRIVPTVYGDTDLLMTDGVKIRVSRNFREQLKALLPRRDA